MRKFILLICILLIASGALGWLRAGTSAGARAPEIDNWGALYSRTTSTMNYAQMNAKIKQSGFLPLTRKEKKALDETSGASVGGEGQDERLRSAPPFPKILSSSRINNRRYVHVLAPDQTVAKLQQGDVLDSGWEIKTVDRRRVIAVFDGEELEIPIIAYLKAAFDPSVESADDDLNKNGADIMFDGE